MAKKRDTSKYREAAKRKWQDPKYRARMAKILSAAQRKRFQRPEEKAKLRRHAHKKMLKQWRDPKYRAHMSVVLSASRPEQSKAMKRKWRTTSYQLKIRRGRKRQWKRHIYRRGVSRRLKQYWSKPEHRVNVGKKVHAAFQKKSVRRRHRISVKKSMTAARRSSIGKTSKKLWGTKSYRELVIRTATAGLRRPEVRAKTGASIKRMWADPKHAKSHAAAVVKNSHYGRYPYTDRRGRKWVFKSGDQWERGFAKWLDTKKLTWLYESRVFALSTGLRYIPDFWVSQWKCHVELKASHKDTLKAEQLRADGHKIIILQGLKAIQRFKEAPALPA